MQQSAAKTRAYALDGLRLLAIVAIIIYHAKSKWLPGGFLGVTMFLTLSGYFITLSIEKTYRQTKKISYFYFLYRRVMRLWPQVLALLGVVALLTLLFAHALLWKLSADIIPAALFYNNIHYIVAKVSYFAAAGLPSPFTHLWFAGLIMQFYMLWPLMLMVLIRFAPTRKFAIAVIVGLAALSFVEMALLYSPLSDTARIYYAPDTRAGEFLLGSAYALYSRGGNAKHAPALSHPVLDRMSDKNLGLLGSVIALIAIICTMVFVGPYSPFPYYGGFALVAILTCILIATLSQTDRSKMHPIERVLGSKPLATLGQRGFALYLWHYPLLIIMNPAKRAHDIAWYIWLIEFVVIYAVAELSYQLFERRHTAKQALPAPLNNPLVRGFLTFSQNTYIGALLCALGIICTLLFSCISFGDLIPNNPNPEKMLEQYQSQSEAALEAVHTDSKTSSDDKSSETDGTSDTSDTKDSEVKEPTEAFTINPETNTIPGKIILIGDSVPAGAIPQFQAAFPNGLIDAVVGRQLYTGQDILASHTQAGYAPDLIVYSIGDNGVATKEQVEALISAAGDKPVILVTVRVPLALQDMNNQLFAQVAAVHDNVSIADWYAVSANHAEYFWDDGTHLRPEGAEAYVNMLKTAISALA